MYSPKKVQDATPEHINASLANVAQAINGLSSQRVVDSSSIYIVKNNGYRIQDASSPPIYVFQMTATAQNLLLPDCSRNIGRTIEVDTVLVGSAPSSYGAVTIKAAGNDTIVGLSSYSITVPWMSATFFSVGTAWIVKVQALSVAPVSGEPSLGTLHPRGTIPGAWDLSARTETTGSPYDWDLSSLVPVGTKTVEIMLVIYRVAVAGDNLPSIELYAWNYDAGALNAYRTYAEGADVRIAQHYGITAGEVAHAAQIATIAIGSSRKIKLGLSTVSTAWAWYAMFRRYGI